MSLIGGIFGGSALSDPKLGINAAQRGFNQKVSAIKEGSNNLQNYTGKANDALMEGKGKAIDFINAGTQDASPYLQQAADLYGGLVPGDMSARAMLLNSLGLNGPEGNAAAVNAFQVSPGYQFQVDEANKNILRNGAATGNVLSGNVGIALNDRARMLANNEFGGWQDRLTGLNQNLYNDFSGKASALGNLATLFNNAGNNKANVSTGTASQLSGNYGNLGTNLNNNNLNIGNAAYQRAQDIFGAQTSAAANEQAQNMALWNSLLGLGGQFASAAGTAGGFGNLFGGGGTTEVFPWLNSGPA